MWTVALQKIVRTTAQLPTAADGVALAGTRDFPPLCVVVPAHNEEGEVAGLVASLKAQDHPGLRVVLALDRCADETRARAEAAIDGDARFEIVDIDHCPDDWAGKVHAAWSGVTRSSLAAAAHHLAFTDADCRFDPACMRATVALLQHRGLDFLSLHSDQSSRDWFERTAQPTACMELLRQYPLLRANRHDANARPFANGQFMLFRKPVYDDIGGHEHVRHHLLEDIVFSRVIRDTGHKGGLLASGGMLTCKMYDSWPEFRRGWKRIFTESANRKSDRLRQSAFRHRAVASVLPVCALIGLLAWWPLWHHAEPWKLFGALAVHAWAVAAWAAASIAFARAGRIPWQTFPAWPLGGWLTAGILIDAARDLERGTPTEWGGRVYDRTDRAADATNTDAPKPVGVTEGGAA